jgi:CheY-like chemotaxis protein
LVHQSPKRCESSRAEKTSSPAVHQEERMGRKILLVDDDPLVLSILAEMFETLGCTVVTAGSAAEALGKLWDPSIQILVTDVNMPAVSGIELARHVQRIRKEVKTLLIYRGGKAMGTDFPFSESPSTLARWLKPWNRRLAFAERPPVACLKTKKFRSVECRLCVSLILTKRCAARWLSSVPAQQRIF